MNYVCASPVPGFINIQIAWSPSDRSWVDGLANLTSLNYALYFFPVPTQIHLPNEVQRMPDARVSSNVVDFSSLFGSQRVCSNTTNFLTWQLSSTHHSKPLTRVGASARLHPEVTKVTFSSSRYSSINDFNMLRRLRMSISLDAFVFTHALPVSV